MENLVGVQNEVIHHKKKEKNRDETWTVEPFIVW